MASTSRFEYCEELKRDLGSISLGHELSTQNLERRQSSLSLESCRHEILMKSHEIHADLLLLCLISIEHVVHFHVNAEECQTSTCLSLT
jgi:hypothetical protein